MPPDSGPPEPPADRAAPPASAIDADVRRRIRSLLKLNPLFRPLRAAELDRLAEVTTLVVFRRGEEVFAEGEASSVLFVVASGRIKVYKTTPEGRNVILEIFGPGDPLGGVAVYEERPYPASAEALEDSLCLAIGRDDLFHLLATQPSLVRGLLSALTRRLVELTQRLAELSAGRVETRLARLFLKLAESFGQAAEEAGVFIPLPLSRQELADLIGTTIETTIRVMSRWGKDEVVATRSDGFVVVDRDELERLAAG